MLKFLLVALAAMFTMSVSAAACDHDTISSVSSDGSIVVMISGAVYSVDSADTVDSMVWLAADNVLICGGTIINTDENGEKVEATRLR